MIAEANHHGGNENQVAEEKHYVEGQETDENHFVKEKREASAEEAEI